MLPSPTTPNHWNNALYASTDNSILTRAVNLYTKSDSHLITLSNKAKPNNYSQKNKKYLKLTAFLHGINYNTDV